MVSGDVSFSYFAQGCSRTSPFEGREQRSLNHTGPTSPYLFQGRKATDVRPTGHSPWLTEDSSISMEGG